MKPAAPTSRPAPSPPDDVLPADLPAPARVLDTSGTLCPFPIVETAKAVKALGPGEVVCVIATDPGVRTDMPMWCKATRNEHLGTFREGSTFRSFVRKRR